MDEPIEVVRSTKAKYVQETFIMRCKPIPPGTPLALRMYTCLPEDIDPQGATGDAPPSFDDDSRTGDPS